MTFILNPYRFVTGGGGGAVSVVGSENVDFDNLTSITVNKPTGTAAGDTMLFMLETRNATPDVNGPDGDSSWTELFRFPVAGGDEFHVIWIKVAGASEPASYGLTLTDTGTQGGKASIATFRDLGAYNTHTYTDDTNVAASQSGTSGGTLVCCYGAILEAGTYDSAPAGMTEVFRFNTNPAGASCKQAMFYEVLASTGATGTRTVGQTNVDVREGATSILFDPA